ANANAMTAMAVIATSPAKFAPPAQEAQQSREHGSQEASSTVPYHLSAPNTPGRSPRCLLMALIRMHSRIEPRCEAGTSPRQLPPVFASTDQAAPDVPSLAAIESSLGSGAGAFPWP